MERDTQRMRDGRPYVFTSLKRGEGVETIAEFILERGFGRA